MNFPRFAYIPQAVFPDQRDGERVFIVARHHILDYLSYIIMLFFLAIIPVGVGLLVSSSTNYISLTDTAGIKLVVTLVLVIYYLLLMIIFMASWVSYYYNLFIVTEERIVEIAQQGFFNHTVYELAFEQIEDVSYSVKGFLYTFLDVGDVEIQTAGSQRNFLIKRMPHPQRAFAIIHEITEQAKAGVPNKNRSPEGETIGVIEGSVVERSRGPLPVMNFKSLTKAKCEYCDDLNLDVPPKGLREKFDRWWWSRMKGEQALYTNYQHEKERKEALRKSADNN